MCVCVGGALGLFIRVTLVSELGVRNAENMGVSHFGLYKLGDMASLGPLLFKILYPH